MTPEQRILVERIERGNGALSLAARFAVRDLLAERDALRAALIEARDCLLSTNRKSCISDMSDALSIIDAALGKEQT